MYTYIFIRINYIFIHCSIPSINTLDTFIYLFFQQGVVHKLQHVTFDCHLLL